MDKEAGEAFQHVGIAAAIPPKKDLVRTEDTRHTVGRHAAMTKDMEIVIPELILDEECHYWTDGAQKAARIAYGIKGEIADDVCTSGSTLKGVFKAVKPYAKEIRALVLARVD